ncbi:MAG: tyrosine-type recombinase/integrase [Pirellulaceae bacterium]|nr:tyrosine-type recombinase/integrase [Pirellulaceae bacterium]
MRKPFYKKSHGCWYVRHNGKDVKLDQDETKAYRIWQRMLDSARAIGDPDISVETLSLRFLAEHKQTLGERAYELLEHYILEFAAHSGTVMAKMVTPATVLAWVKGKTTWGDYCKRDGVNSVRRMYKWAVENEYLVRNPIIKVKTITPVPRHRLVANDQHKALIEKSRVSRPNGREFALYLIASRCGARPAQIRDVTASNYQSFFVDHFVEIAGKQTVVKVEHGMWVFDKHKTAAATGRQLTVYLSPCLQTLTKILMAKRPDGPLFLTVKKHKWTKDSAGKRMRKLRRALGLPEDMILYSYRHTFATNSLLSGNSIAEVAELLGHTSTRMVSQVYGHLDQHKRHLASAALKSAKKQQE